MEKYYYNNDELNALAYEILRQDGTIREVPPEVVSEEKILRCNNQQESELVKITSGPNKKKLQEVRGSICPISDKPCVKIAVCGRLRAYNDCISLRRGVR